MGLRNFHNWTFRRGDQAGRCRLPAPLSAGAGGRACGPLDHRHLAAADGPRRGGKSGLIVTSPPPRSGFAHRYADKYVFAKVLLVLSPLRPNFFKSLLVPASYCRVEPARWPRFRLIPDAFDQGESIMAGRASEMD